MCQSSFTHGWLPHYWYQFYWNALYIVYLFYLFIFQLLSLTLCKLNLIWLWEPGFKYKIWAPSSKFQRYECKVWMPYHQYLKSWQDFQGSDIRSLLNDPKNSISEPIMIRGRLCREAAFISRLSRERIIQWVGQEKKSSWTFCWAGMPLWVSGTVLGMQYYWLAMWCVAYGLFAYVNLHAQNI